MSLQHQRCACACVLHTYPAGVVGAFAATAASRVVVCAQVPGWLARRRSCSSIQGQYAGLCPWDSAHYVSAFRFRCRPCAPVLSCPGMPLLYQRCACACVLHTYPAGVVGAFAATAASGVVVCAQEPGWLSHQRGCSSVQGQHAGLCPWGSARVAVFHFRCDGNICPPAKADP